MKVKELKKELGFCDDEAEVIVSGKKVVKVEEISEELPGLNSGRYLKQVILKCKEVKDDFDKPCFNYEKE